MTNPRFEWFGTLSCMQPHYRAKTYWEREAERRARLGRWGLFYEDYLWPLQGILIQAGLFALMFTGFAIAVGFGLRLVLAIGGRR